MSAGLIIDKPYEFQIGDLVQWRSSVSSAWRDMAVVISVGDHVAASSLSRGPETIMVVNSGLM